MRRTVLMCLVPLTIVLVLGCGGGSDGLIDRSGTGTLTAGDIQLNRGSADFVTFRATRTGWVDASMDPRGSLYWLEDPYIIVREGTENTWNSYADYATDDDSGPGSSALCSFYVYGGEQYTVAFTTYDGGYGDYYWGILELGVTSAPVAAPADAAAKGPAPTCAKPNDLK